MHGFVTHFYWRHTFKWKILNFIIFTLQRAFTLFLLLFSCSDNVLGHTKKSFVSLINTLSVLHFRLVWVKSTLVTKTFPTAHVVNIWCRSLSRALHICNIFSALYSFLRSYSKFLLSNRPHYEWGGIFVVCGPLLASIQSTATTDIDQHLFKHLPTFSRTIFIQHQSVLLQLTVPYLFFALHQN